ncbi:hypothetical protein B484DRAFT_405740 [Ochromonadaceae sp. CCMP2298]|nr:hypothetical protein B484DRAFT_405740 [Ochromonadaceae sp. CCMP2298]
MSHGKNRGNGFQRGNKSHTLRAPRLPQLLPLELQIPEPCPEGTGLSATLICRAFSTTVGNISWPKLPGYQRFFQCSWPPLQQYEATVKPCCIDNALMLQVVQEFMQLSHKQLQRSYKEHGYLLIFYLSDRVNMQSGMYSRYSQDVRDGVSKQEAVAVDVGAYRYETEVQDV